MKILSFSLFCFIFCILGFCDRSEECDKRDLPSFDCSVYAMVIDTENGINCGPYNLEFEKYHCEGGASSLMRYGFDGCAEEDGVTYLVMSGMEYYTVTISNRSDYLFFYLKDDSQTLYAYQLFGEDINYYTDYGKKSGILVTFTVPNFQASVTATAN